ncbi:hypothetical protein [Bdellovibrio sp. HCB337]|uniref:hypothetical protein n=1 Tax=Bdellovibrio sp. HCB337 TaxID=3394358 RepID=UPI0039A5B5AB
MKTLFFTLILMAASQAMSADTTVIDIHAEGMIPAVTAFAAEGKLRAHAAGEKAKIEGNRICRSLDFEKASAISIQRGTFPDDSYSWTHDAQDDYFVVNSDLNLEEKTLAHTKQTRFTNPITAVVTSMVAYELDTIQRQYRKHYFFSKLACTGSHPRAQTPEQAKVRAQSIVNSGGVFTTKIRDQYRPIAEGQAPTAQAARPTSVRQENNPGTR